MIIDLLFMGGGKGGEWFIYFFSIIFFWKKNIDVNGDEIVINSRILGINVFLVYWKEFSLVY